VWILAKRTALQAVAAAYSTPTRSLRRSQRELFLRIHMQNTDGSSADSRFTAKVEPPPLEVLCPAVLARVEKLCHCATLRINPRKIRSLVQVAINAR
jgi:hypothetical protein